MFSTIHLCPFDAMSRSLMATAALPLHFFGVAGDKESQRSLLHLHVVARVDEDAGRSHKQTRATLINSRTTSPFMHTTC